jgi:hypothetical protein
MQKAFAIRFLLTVLVIGCAVYSISFTRYGALPFSTHAGSAGTVVVQPWPDTKLPPGLRAGDVLELSEQSLAVRFLLGRFAPPDETYTLAVRRGARTLPVQVTTSRFHSPSRQFILGVLYFFPLVLGLATLWWAPEKRASALFLFVRLEKKKRSIRKERVLARMALT